MIALGEDVGHGARGAFAHPTDETSIPCDMQQGHRHPEVCAAFGAPRRMLFGAMRAAILRGAQENARTSRVNAIAFIPGMTQH
jgi:hypothetical protein